MDVKMLLEVQSGFGSLFPQMILDFSELRVYFQRRLRGVVYGMFHAAVNMDKKRKTFGGFPPSSGTSSSMEFLC